MQARYLIRATRQGISVKNNFPLLIPLRSGAFFKSGGEYIIGVIAHVIAFANFLVLVTVSRSARFFVQLRSRFDG